MSENNEVTMEQNVDRIPSKPLTRRSIKQTFRRKLSEATKEAEEAGLDGLTGLPQRKAFDKRIKEEASRLKRTKGTTTVIILDADKLKDINDGPGGHAAGDKYLKSIADSLTSAVRREIDYVARIGGDEFALILPNTDGAGAEKMWELTLNPAFIRNDIKISGGAAELDPKNPEESIKHADKGMYGAKRDKDRRGENMLFTYVPMKK